MGCCYGAPRRKDKGKPSLSLDITNGEESRKHPTVPLDTLKDLVSVQLYDDPDPAPCPYCSKQASDLADMMICNSQIMPYDMFEKIMERGWWRTGNVIFKPQVARVCCPSYAIHLPVNCFQVSKSHRNILNRWKRFLLNGDPRWDNRTAVPNGGGSHPATPINAATPMDQITPCGNSVSPSAAAIGAAVAHAMGQNTSLEELSQMEAQSGLKKPKKQVSPGIGADPSKPPCRKAKERRNEKREAKMAERENPGISQNERLTHEQPHAKKSVLDIVREHEADLATADTKHKLEMRLVSNEDPEMSTTLTQFFNLYDRFQDAVHPGKSKFSTRSDLHWGFITSPLAPGGSDQNPLGTYHMRYYLDGELVMLSVMDILPHYLVSIYFIYDPALRFLRPGIYTCLREIALVQELQETRPEMRYYNLGYYNSFSPKVSYKSQFKPTEILCPITNRYVPLEEAIPKLKLERYCRFADDDVESIDSEGLADISNIVILDRTTYQATYFRDLPRPMRQSLKPVLLHYLKETGTEVVKGMLLSH